MQQLIRGDSFHEAPASDCVFNVNASGGFELFSYGLSRMLATFTHHGA